jgi:hypothetical protein
VAGLLANWACGPHASRWWSGEWSKRTHGRSLGQTAGFTFGFLGAICPDCGCLRTGYPRIPCLITIFPILQSQCDFCLHQFRTISRSKGQGPISINIRQAPGCLQSAGIESWWDGDGVAQQWTATPTIWILRAMSFARP